MLLLKPLFMRKNPTLVLGFEGIDTAAGADIKRSGICAPEADVKSSCGKLLKIQ